MPVEMNSSNRLGRRRFTFPRGARRQNTSYRRRFPRRDNFNGRNTFQANYRKNGNAMQIDFNNSSGFRQTRQKSQRPLELRRQPLAQRRQQRPRQRQGPTSQQQQRKGRRSVRKQPFKKTRQDLDMDIDKYMGNESVQARLDAELDAYFASS